MRLLCIGDIHGHASALERVLALGHERACALVLVAGDLCFPGPEPRKTFELLERAGARCVRGLSDAALATIDPAALVASTPQQAERARLFRECRERLGPALLRRLGALPVTFRMETEDGGELLLVHGSPRDPGTAVSHDMDDVEIDALLGDDPAPLVVCGASHVPFERVVGGTRVVNVGSVGEAPGGQVAHATIVVTSPAGSAVEQVAVALGGPV
jgi:predicted phosphodiesterase